MDAYLRVDSVHNFIGPGPAVIQGVRHGVRGSTETGKSLKLVSGWETHVYWGEWNITMVPVVDKCYPFNGSVVERKSNVQAGYVDDITTAFYISSDDPRKRAGYN